MVPDRIQPMLDKLHGVRRRQNTDHFEHSNAECTHFSENLPLPDNDYENPCDCPEQTYEYLSTEKSLGNFSLSPKLTVSIFNKIFSRSACIGVAV